MDINSHQSSTSRSALSSGVSAHIWFPYDEKLSINATDWARFEKEERQLEYKLMPHGTNCFTKLTDINVKLILLCHGCEDNELKTDKQVKQVMKNQLIEYTSKSDTNTKPNKTYLNPEQMALFLENNGLNKNHRIIEMASCFSNFYAKGLQEAMAKKGFCRKSLKMLFYLSYICPGRN